MGGGKIHSILGWSDANGKLLNFLLQRCNSDQKSILTMLIHAVNFFLQQNYFLMPHNDLEDGKVERDETRISSIFAFDYLKNSLR